jgi:endonuclease/exonuclease/phosphatase family metal-dependent hydrolase
MFRTIHLRRPLPSEGRALRFAELRQGVECDGERPDVIAGDFNEPPGGATGRWLESQGYIDAVATHQPTRLDKGRFDYIWIAPSVRERMADGSAASWEQLACDDDGKTHLNDHRPLWLTLR